MTHSPITLEYARPPGKYSRAGVLVSWIIIVATVASVAYANWRASRTESRTEAAADFQISLTGRLTVGEARAFSGMGFLPDTTTPTMLARLKVAAASPAQKLRIVPVIGEVQGRTAAIKALDDLAPLLDRPELKDDAAALRQIYTTGPGKLSESQRRQLVEREGWFGRLALSFGLPDSDPIRAQVLHRAHTTFFVLIGFELLVALAILLGFVLLVVGIILLALGSIRPVYRPVTPRTSTFLEAFALYLGGYMAIGLLVRQLASGSVFLTTAIALGWVPFAMLWPLLRGAKWSELREGLGWNAGRGAFREIVSGIAGYLCGLPIIAVAMVITLLLASHSGAPSVHPIIFSNTRGAWPIVQLYLVAVIWAPIVEETMFRGALFSHLRQSHRWLVSAALSSFIFAAVHPQGWAVIPLLGSIALVLAGIREWRGSALASMTAHAMNNLVAVTLLIVALK
jgi:membrane protease YdiL (CAAX protease family)